MPNYSPLPAKHEEIKALGASRIVSSRDTSEWEALKGQFDLIVVTVAVPLDWNKIIEWAKLHRNELIKLGANAIPQVFK